MKRLSFLIPFLFAAFLVSAQSGKVNQALTYSKPEYNQLDKAKELIEAATIHEKTKNLAKTWKVRGEVYFAISQTDKDEFKKLSENPLQESYDSFMKAIELDENDKMKKYIYPKMDILKIALFNKGGEYYNSQDYPSSFRCFENALKISDIVTPEVIDTSIVLNTGYTAHLSKMYPEALKYYNRAADSNLGGLRTLISIATVYKESGDTASFISTLTEGVEKYPSENLDLILELINYYLTNNESDKAMEYINKAMEQDDTNHLLHFAKGTLLDKMGKLDEAKVSYAKAIEIKPDFFNAYYNLGALYFNKGVKIIKDASDIPANKQKEYEATLESAYVLFEEAIPYLEDAYRLKPDEDATAQTLKEIYFKIRSKKSEYQTRYEELKKSLDK